MLQNELLLWAFQGFLNFGVPNGSAGGHSVTRRRENKRLRQTKWFFREKAVLGSELPFHWRKDARAGGRHRGCRKWCVRRGNGLLASSAAQLCTTEGCSLSEILTSLGLSWKSFCTAKLCTADRRSQRNARTTVWRERCLSVCWTQSKGWLYQCQYSFVAT